MNPSATRPFVLDCSVTVSWAFEDQAGGYPDHVLDLLGAGNALVPGHWSLEVSNVLLVAERRGRITQSDAGRFVELLRHLPIPADQDTSARALRETLLLARATSLSAYDAAYLELAMRLGLSMATQDAALVAAAQALGVEIVA